MSNKETHKGIYEKCIKRMCDFVISLIAIIVLAIPMLIIAFFVLIFHGHPVLFRQPRPGRHGRIFYMYKFRSMTNATDKDGKLLKDDKRLTKFGKRLRDSSLDELPELFNILRGDMSIVGPRPQLVRDMVFMTPEQNRRHSVPQGLTGLAQVNGRNGISWEEKLDYDIQYVDHITFWMDFKIFMKTIAKVFKREGITEEGMATATDFGDYLLETGKITKEEYDKKQAEALELIRRAKG